MSQPNTRFHHGYQHCLGEDCPHPSDCAIHMAYEEAKKLNLKDIKTYPNCGDGFPNYTRVHIEGRDDE